MRKPLAFATITGIAIATPMMASSPAMADDDSPATTVGDGACMAPSQWDDPLDIVTQYADYTDFTDDSACGSTTASEAQDADGPDGSCAAPWYWTGPGDALARFLDAQDTNQSVACDDADMTTAMQ
jgi:hypothetical protein